MKFSLYLIILSKNSFPKDGIIISNKLLKFSLATVFKNWLILSLSESICGWINAENLVFIELNLIDDPSKSIFSQPYKETSKWSPLIDNTTSFIFLILESIVSSVLFIISSDKS